MSHAILGARGDIQDPDAVFRTSQGWARAHDTEVLLVDARVVFGRDHLESAVRHAERARAADRAGARTLALETLRYLAGQRQLADAIRVAGLRNGSRTIGLVLWPSKDASDLLRTLGWRRDDATLEPAGKRLKAVGITKAEEGTVDVAGVYDLALEKVALLDVAK